MHISAISIKRLFLGEFPDGQDRQCDSENPDIPISNSLGQRLSPNDLDGIYE
jgi:hypothetical protein